MKSVLRHPLFLVTFGVILFSLCTNLDSVIGVLRSGAVIIAPILLGLLLAFILNVPMTGFERAFARLFPNAKNQKTISAASLFATLLAVVFIIVLALKLLVPSLIASLQHIYPVLAAKWPQWRAILQQYQVDTSQIAAWISSVSSDSSFSDIESIVESLISGVRATMLSVTSFAFGMVIAVYILLSKHQLAAQAKKLAYAYLNQQLADRFCHVARLAQQVYAKFLSGQSVEAVLLGLLIFGTFSVLRLPYAALTGFLTGLFAFVPYIGAWASCAISTFLIFLTEPDKALPAFFAYAIVQFIENQFIYPHVVGGSVGLSPLLTLLAALIGVKAFGLLGMVLFIPLASVIYLLIKDDVNRRLMEKNLQKGIE